MTGVLEAAHGVANKKVKKLRQCQCLYFLGIGKKRQCDFSELHNSEEKIPAFNNPYPDERRSKHVTFVENATSFFSLPRLNHFYNNCSSPLNYV